MTLWEGFLLRQPLFLLLLLPVLWLFLRLRRRTGPAILFSPLMLLPREEEASLWRRLLPLLPSFLWAAGMVAVIVALADPARVVESARERQGIDIVLCLDVSSSMHTRDMAQNRDRLELALSAARDFVLSRPQDRFALVSFARYPDVQVPLTLDHDALLGALDNLAVVEPDGPEDATGIGLALARSAQLLRSSADRSPLVILLTDGVENVALLAAQDQIAPLHGAQVCRSLGIRVHAVQAGRGRLDRHGRWQALDSSQLLAVAERSGGSSFRADDAGALREVFRAMDRLEAQPWQETRWHYHDLHVFFLLCALVFLVGSRILRSTVVEVVP